MDLCSIANEKAYLWACMHFEPLDEIGKKKTLTIYAEFISVYAAYQRHATQNKYDIAIPQDFMDCIHLAFPEARIGPQGSGYSEGIWKDRQRIGVTWIDPKIVIYEVRYIPEGCGLHIPEPVRIQQEYMQNRSYEIAERDALQSH